jgi:hypothetical protein
LVIYVDGADQRKNQSKVSSNSYIEPFFSLNFEPPVPPYLSPKELWLGSSTNPRRPHNHQSFYCVMESKRLLTSRHAMSLLAILTVLVTLSAINSPSIAVLGREGVAPPPL